MSLSEAQASAVGVLMQSAPDALLVRLSAVLSAASVDEPAFAPVSTAARHEAEDRRTRDLVLAPLRPLADPSLSAPQGPLVSPLAYRELWRALKQLAPAAVSSAEAAALKPYADNTPPALAALYQIAAEALTSGAASGVPQNERTRLATLLRLSFILRRLQPRLAGWLHNLNGENMAAVRLAFKDAVGEVDDGGPLFVEALQIYLDEPAQVLRLISVVMDRPSDRYLAGSEMAFLGERLLVDVASRLNGLARFDPLRGREGGAAAAASLLIASQTLSEFETSLNLAKDGPWAVRVAAHKQVLTDTAEARIREAEPAVAAALPLQVFRMPGALAPRAGPRVDGYPVDALVRRAEGLLAFLYESRAVATSAGFGALRARAIGSLGMRLDLYVEDLVERLHAESGEDGEQVRAHLEVAAEFLGLVRGPDTAQIVRRRAAAA
jgi:hypothetical protein